MLKCHFDIIIWHLEIKLLTEGGLQLHFCNNFVQSAKKKKKVMHQCN